jgi:beta,beta-carotene 9',10'-dioxygenase
MSQTIPADSRFRVVEAALKEPAAQAPAFDRAPFRWSQRAVDTLPVHTRGRLPDWLQGQLVRTSPAVFETAGWRAAHWFDGLALLYGFSFEPGRVSFRQRLLDSRFATLAEQGLARTGTFGTPMKRNFFQRLLAPVPPITDNTNVNVVPWQGAWLAMTETPHQHVIDGGDMATRGLYRYQDKLPGSLNMTAHPHFDFDGKAMVNIGIHYGRKTEFSVFRQGTHDKARTVEGKLAFERAPYLHDFGCSARHVVVIDHPLRGSAASMLFSNRPLIEHYKWQPETGTRLWKFERASGRWSSYETDALFCFHVVNTFEEGDDVVFDFVAYDDASIVDALRTDKLAAGELPAMTPRYVRARLRPGAKRAELELLSNQGFDFPAIAYRREHGKPYQQAWGVSLYAADAGWQSQLVRVSTTGSEVRSFAERDVTYGEPVFVPHPQASHAGQGVILSVGSHLREERASLAVLDAETMVPLAHCDVELSLPLGFHGNFQARG